MFKSLYICSTIFYVFSPLIKCKHIQNAYVCMAMAMSLHYFQLVTLSWSFIAGYQIYLLLVVIFDCSSERASKMPKYKILCYGAPAAAVILTYAIDSYVLQGATYNPSSSMESTKLGCWMSTNILYITMFFIPVIVMLSINFGMLCK